MEKLPASGPENVRPGLPEDLFLSPNRFPGEPPAPSSPPPPAPVRRGKSKFTRVVLPLGLFVAGIGAVAWVTQWLPGRAPRDDSPPPAQAVPVQLKPLLPPFSLWEDPNSKFKEYRAEFEIISSDGKLDGGHHDYAFQNENPSPIEVGLADASCQCSSIHLALISESQWQEYVARRKGKDPVSLAREVPKDDYAWTQLERERPGLTVPGGGRALVRLFWDGKKKEPQPLRLTFSLWVSPPGKLQERQPVPFAADVTYVAPVNFSPEQIDVGGVEPGGSTAPGSFVVWSATRDLEVAPREGDPCLEVTATALSPEERGALREELLGRNIQTRVRSAYRVLVRVHEQRGGAQLDLGSFQRPVNLTIKGGGEPLQVTPPTVRGYVLGDVKIGADPQQQRLQLGSFPAKFGDRKTFSIWVKPGLELSYEGCTPKGLGLEVKLRKLEKESSREWKVWEVEITVPPGVATGTLPDDTALLLRVAGSPRRVRIPVTGVASAGRG